MTPINLFDYIYIIVSAIVIADLTGYAFWLVMGQEPLGNFYLGMITNLIFNLF